MLFGKIEEHLSIRKIEEHLRTKSPNTLFKERLHLSEMKEHFAEIMHSPPQLAVVITAHYVCNFAWSNIS